MTQISKRHRALAAQILSDQPKRSKKRNKRGLPEDKLPAIVSINSHRHEPHHINPYASCSIVGAGEALEAGISFGKYGSRDIHSKL